VRLGWEFVGINISPHTLVDPRFDELLEDQIGRHVVLELTDHARQPDWPILRGYLERARDLGARIAVNALTSDPSGQFQRVIDIAPDIVKLDTAYTSTLLDNRRSRGVAEEFLLACSRRGVFVIGVGVEEPWQLDALRELGVDAAQGYLLGRPQPIDSFEPRT
jgi:EAL domain-containing protein (putative c-di-GMP-specific phosphodiesterase class I)